MYNETNNACATLVEFDLANQAFHMVKNKVRFEIEPF